MESQHQKGRGKCAATGGSNFKNKRGRTDPTEKRTGAPGEKGTGECARDHQNQRVPHMRVLGGEVVVLNGIKG